DRARLRRHLHRIRDNGDDRHGHEAQSFGPGQVPHRRRDHADGRDGRKRLPADPGADDRAVAHRHRDLLGVHALRREPDRDGWRAAPPHLSRPRWLFPPTPTPSWLPPSPPAPPRAEATIDAAASDSEGRPRPPFSFPLQKNRPPPAENWEGGGGPRRYDGRSAW